jgi:metal-dependent hydrolase (beta-lactamase superfamily II)
MDTDTQTEELIVWTKPQALEEAKLVFGNDKGLAFSKGQVGVVFLSHPDDDHGIGTTLAALRNARFLQSSSTFPITPQTSRLKSER